ncbi:hypothetical protein ABPG73_008608 [Tetrahymena malaccensis]
MSHVYYFGNESFKPLGYIELEDGDLFITRIRFSEEDMNEQEFIGFDDSFYKSKKYKYDRKFQKVESGCEVVYVLDERGQIWTFGSGSKGQLGLDKSIHKINKPMNIHKYRNAIKDKVKYITACYNHTLALTDTNKIYAWGESINGKLFDLDQNLILRPTLINQNQFNFGEGIDCDNFDGNYYNQGNLTKSSSSLLKRESSMRAINRNSQDKASVSQFSLNLKSSLKERSPGKMILQKNISQISQQQDSINTPLSIDSSQQLLNSDSKRFLPSIQKNKQSLQLINRKTSHYHGNRKGNYEAEDFQSNRSIKGSIFSNQINQNQNKNTDPILLAVGSIHSLIYINGKMYSCGKNYNGILGIGQSKIEYTKIPQQISFPKKAIKIVGISANFFHSLAWDDHGNIYSWGEGQHGQLGHPIEKGYSFNKQELSPKRIQTLQGKFVIQASCGMKYSAAITNEGELYGWGKGDYNQVESQEDQQNSLMDSLYPKKLMPEDSNFIHVKFIKVSCGASHNATIDQFGRLYTWGNSSEYCLGHQNQQDLKFPQLVRILKDKVTIDVSCGDKFTVVIQEEDVSGRKANIVDQFKQRNISNIRQKIKSLYDYSKLKMNAGGDVEEKENEKQTTENKQDESVIDQNMSGLNISLSYITPDSPISQRIDKDSPKKSKRGLKLNLKQVNDLKQPAAGHLPHLSNQSSMQFNYMTNLNSNNHTHRNEFEIDLEELIDKRNGSGDFDFQDSKDSQNQLLKNIKSALEKDFSNSKTYRAIQDNLQIKNLKEFLKKQHKNIKDSNLKVTHRNNSEQIQIVFDECSEALDQKEQNDPLYLPFISPYTNSSNQTAAYFDLNEDGHVKQIAENKQEQILSQHSAISQFLGNLLETKNETLKYEYIEMVRRGLEDSHLFYLISDPKEGIVQNNREREKLKQHLNKKIINYSQMNVQVIGETKKIVEAQKKYMTNLINNCRKAQEKAKQVVGKFNKYSGVDPTLLKPNKRYAPLLNAMSSPEEYKKYHDEKLKQQQDKKNERIQQAEERREEIFLQKRNAMIKKIEEKSIHYNKEQVMLKEIIQRDLVKKKLVIKYLQTEQMLQFFNGIARICQQKKKQNMIEYISQKKNSKKGSQKSLPSLHVIKIQKFNLFQNQIGN